MHICERCQSEAWMTRKSVMNEDAICFSCYQEEINHPRYDEARDMEVMESWKGNKNYPGLFAGQKYPFHHDTPQIYAKKMSIA